MTLATTRTIPPDGMNPQYICARHSLEAIDNGEWLRTLDLTHGEANLECERCDPAARRRNIENVR